jgi:hypothetical protein
MRWGEEHSPGHYLDLAGTLGVTLFPLGYLLGGLTSRRDAGGRQGRPPAMLTRTQAVSGRGLPPTADLVKSYHASHLHLIGRRRFAATTRFDR